MEAAKLPERMAVLKQDINKLLMQFNNEVGLEISEVHVQGLSSTTSSGVKKTAAYDVAIGMDF
jgi:hypothetical protein